MSNSAVFCRVCGRDHGLETACGGTPTFNAPIVTIPPGEPQNPRWRVGGKIPLNVYDGDKPMFQCHTPEDAERIVTLLNNGSANPPLYVNAAYEQTIKDLKERNAEIIKAADSLAEAGKRMVAGQYVCPHAPCLCRFCAMRAALAQHAAAKGER